MNSHEEVIINDGSCDIVNGLVTVNRFDEYKGAMPTWEELEATFKRL